MKVRMYHDGDDVFVAWDPDGAIDACRGFALMRRRNGTEETVTTWVGFAGQDHALGEHRPSTEWPIQKYQWTDYLANPGDRLQYQVVPMVGADKDHLTADTDHASDWTDEVVLTPEASPKIEPYFNRGVVAAQWVSRRLDITESDFAPKGDDDPAGKKLLTVIATPGDPLRDYLTGPLGARLFALLASAATDGRDVYAALYELDDPQLESALELLGQHAHVVLGNGSVKKKGEDQNAAARALLVGKIDLHDRMTSPRALAHNKFLVICDTDGSPRWVWTGSQNWSMTGLCTQANNSVLIDDPALAARYRSQWDLLKDAGAATPTSLKTSNTAAQDFSIGTESASLWFTPTIGQVDLDEARSLILAAKQAILFLMFNPGPADTLLNTIITEAQAVPTGDRLFIRGAINQDPSTAKTKVDLFDDANVENADYDVVLPAAIDAPTAWFVRELKKAPGAFAMVHSKVVVVDPFTDHPVVMTGSHNLGPKASGTNDENFLIIRDAPGLASAYVTNIMSVYNQYHWRFASTRKSASKAWTGLADDDSWQPWNWSAGDVKDARLREIAFWVGGA